MGIYMFAVMFGVLCIGATAHFIRCTLNGNVARALAFLGFAVIVGAPALRLVVELVRGIIVVSP